MRQIIANFLGTLFVLCTVSGTVLLFSADFTMPASYRLSDLGCIILFIFLMASLASLYPLAVKIDREGRWHN